MEVVAAGLVAQVVPEASTEAVLEAALMVAGQMVNDVVRVEVVPHWKGKPPKINPIRLPSRTQSPMPNPKRKRLQKSLRQRDRKVARREPLMPHKAILDRETQVPTDRVAPAEPLAVVGRAVEVLEGLADSGASDQEGLDPGTWSPLRSCSAATRTKMAS